MSPIYWAAERHGLTLAVEPTREAAAATRVSRIDLRPTTYEKWLSWHGPGYPAVPRPCLALSERGLLQAIRTDCQRVLWVAACDCQVQVECGGETITVSRDCTYVSDCEHCHPPRLPGYDHCLDAITEDLVAALEARIEAIDAELRELDAMRGQRDMFPPPSARPPNVVAFPPQFRCVTGGAT